MFLRIRARAADILQAMPITIQHSTPKTTNALLDNESMTTEHSKKTVKMINNTQPQHVDNTDPFD